MSFTSVKNNGFHRRYRVPNYNVSNQSFNTPEDTATFDSSSKAPSRKEENQKQIQQTTTPSTSNQRTTPNTVTTPPINLTTPSTPIMPPSDITISPGTGGVRTTPSTGTAPSGGTMPRTTPGTGTAPSSGTIPRSTPSIGTTPSTSPGTGSAPSNGTMPRTTSGMGTMPGTSPGRTMPTTPDPTTAPDMDILPRTPGIRTTPSNGTMPRTTPGMGTMPGTAPGMNTTPGTSPGTGTMPGTSPGRTMPGMDTMPGTSPVRTMPTTPSPGMMPRSNTEPAAPYIYGTTPGEFNLPSYSNDSEQPVPGAPINQQSMGNSVPYYIPGMNYPTYPGIPNMYPQGANPYQIPMGIPMIPLYGYDNSEDLDRDVEYMKRLYPRTAKLVQKEVDEECDKMEHDGSMMFDEYPDKEYLEKIIDRIYNRIDTQGQEPKVEMKSLYFYPPERGSNHLRDIVSLVLLSEIFHRRRRHRSRRRWF
jgi:hypothetical protein